MGPVSEQQITLGVLTKDNKENILRCLNSLCRQTYRSIEITIIDHGSEKEVLDAILEFPLPFCHRIYLNRENNLGKSRDFILRNSRSPFVAFIDSDCEAQPDWLENLIRAHKMEESGRCIGVGGANAAPTDSHLFYKVLSICTNSFWGNGNSSQAKPIRMKRQENHLPTCNLLLKRSLAIGIGGFSSDFHFVCEDLDFSKRAEKEGYHFVAIPNASVSHWHSLNPIDWGRKMFRYGRGQILIQKKHPGHLFSLKGMPILLFFSWIVILCSNIKLGLLLPLGYVAVLLLVAIHSCRNEKMPKLFLFVFANFLITHICYGSGELYELICGKSQKKNREMNQGNKDDGFILLKNKN